jgi:hypothetical protein
VSKKNNGQYDLFMFTKGQYIPAGGIGHMLRLIKLCYFLLVRLNHFIRALQKERPVPNGHWRPWPCSG